LAECNLRAWDMYAGHTCFANCNKFCVRRYSQMHLALAGSRKLGHKVSSEPFFDTVRIDVGDADKVMQAALKASVNLRQLDSSSVSIALDETTMVEDIDTLFSVLNGGSKPDFDALSLADQV